MKPARAAGSGTVSYTHLYQFVNGLLFTMAGMLAAQQRRAAKDLEEGGGQRSGDFASPLIIRR